MAYIRVEVAVLGPVIGIPFYPVLSLILKPS